MRIVLKDAAVICRDSGLRFHMRVWIEFYQLLILPDAGKRRFTKAAEFYHSEFPKQRALSVVARTNMVIVGEE
jgi:hypothetical protein